MVVECVTVDKSEQSPRVSADSSNLRDRLL